MSVHPDSLSYPNILPCQGREAGIYPNVDISIWLRSCQNDVYPTPGTRTGTIPAWLSGSLVQNGPGRFQYGPDRFQHLFDGSAVLQRFHIANGEVEYMCKLVRSEAYKKNSEANAIVVPEFGTTIEKPFWKKLSRKQLMSDNTMITVYPFDGSLYTFYESPFIYRLDAETLDTLSSVDFGKFGMLAHASHVHFDNQGNMLSLGMKVGLTGPVYEVNKFSPLPNNSQAAITNNGLDVDHSHVSKDIIIENNNDIKQKEALEGSRKRSTCPANKSKSSGLGRRVNSWLRRTKREINIENCPLTDRRTSIQTIPCRWKFSPGYMHSFSITERFVILVEQPLTVSIRKMLIAIMTNRPLSSTLTWKDKGVRFHVIDKVMDNVYPVTYVAESFFYLHTINAYEDNDHIVIDICAYNSPAMMDCMFISELQFAQSNPSYAKLFKGWPRRYVIPLKPKAGLDNQVQLSYTKATAQMVKASSTPCRRPVVNLVPEMICNHGCETPTINYDKVNGKPYKYFYAITSDVDADNAGKLLKVEPSTGEVWTWKEENTYCSEPMFVQEPGTTGEDEGVLLTSIIRGKPEVTFSGLVVLDARNLTEIARVEFKLPGPVPKPLHGSFLPSWDFKQKFQ